MKAVSLLKPLALVTTFLVVSCNGMNGNPSARHEIAPESMTDYIYEILKAERSVYDTQVVQRLKEDGVVFASENWQQEKALLLPAQMFRMTAQEASKSGAFNYRSISPWNLNEGNAPRTEVEKQAMQQVIETGLAVKKTQTIAGKKYFSAVYPDKATTAACVECHNNHPIHKQRYPDKVFKLGDVMGGILVNLPLKPS